MAYDKPLRLRVIEYKDGGHTCKEVEEAFGVDSKRYYSLKKPVLLNTNRHKSGGEK